jgi:hypothetical protein
MAALKFEVVGTLSGSQMVGTVVASKLPRIVIPVVAVTVAGDVSGVAWELDPASAPRSVAT